MYNLTEVSLKPLKVTVCVDNVELDMEVDTGASVSIISEETYNRLWPEGQQSSLQESAITLRTYSGEQLSIKGTLPVDIQHKDQKACLQLVVATGRGPSLLGRDWLSKIRLDWTELCNNHACYSLSLQDILDENSWQMPQKEGDYSGTVPFGAVDCHNFLEYVSHSVEFAGLYALVKSSFEKEFPFCQ